jgi:nicotinamidase-related amidase
VPGVITRSPCHGAHPVRSTHSVCSAARARFEGRHPGRAGLPDGLLQDESVRGVTWPLGAPGDYEGWIWPSFNQRIAMVEHDFALGSWGGEFRPDLQPRPDDVVAHEHWSSNGFAATDLDLQLRQHSITHVIGIGELANTCIECTGRAAAERGYHVTLVRDATPAFRPEMMRGALEFNGPTYANAYSPRANSLRRFRRPSPASVLLDIAERRRTTKPNSAGQERFQQVRPD